MVDVAMPAAFSHARNSPFMWLAFSALPGWAANRQWQRLCTEVAQPPRAAAAGGAGRRLAAARGGWAHAPVQSPVS